MWDMNKSIKSEMEEPEEEKEFKSIKEEMEDMNKTDINIPEFSDIKISNEKIKNLILSLIGEDQEMEYARLNDRKKEQKIHEDKIKEIEGIFLFIGFMEYDEKDKENIWGMDIPSWIPDYIAEIL